MPKYRRKSRRQATPYWERAKATARQVGELVTNPLEWLHPGALEDKVQRKAESLLRPAKRSGRKLRGSISKKRRVAPSKKGRPAPKGAPFRKRRKAPLFQYSAPSQYASGAPQQYAPGETDVNPAPMVVVPSLPLKSRKHAPTMVRYGGRKRKRRGRRRSKRPRKARRRYRKIRRKGPRVVSTGRPLTKIVKLRFVQEFTVDPYEGRWGYMKFYPADLTYAVMQDSLDWNVTETNTVKPPNGSVAHGADPTTVLGWEKHLASWMHVSPDTPSTSLNPADDLYRACRFQTIDGAGPGGLITSNRDDRTSILALSTKSATANARKLPFGLHSWLGTAAGPNLYAKYKVLGAKFKITHTPTSQSQIGSGIQMGFTKQDIPVANGSLYERTTYCAASEVAEFINQRHVKKWTKFFSGTKGHSCTGFYSAKKAVRQAKRRGQQDVPDQSGTTTASPELNPAINFVVAPSVDQDIGQTSMRLVATYVVRFSDLEIKDASYGL